MFITKGFNALHNCCVLPNLLQRVLILWYAGEQNPPINMSTPLLVNMFHVLQKPLCEGDVICSRIFKI